MYIGVWGQTVLLPACRQKVTTTRRITLWLFNVQHIPKLLPGKAQPAGQHRVFPPLPAPGQRRIAPDSSFIIKLQLLKKTGQLPHSYAPAPTQMSSPHYVGKASSLTLTLLPKIMLHHFQCIQCILNESVTGLGHEKWSNVYIYIYVMI